ncbi:MAG: hypothetical protein K6T73_11400 [Candidatus Bathyarchaeota archaeon]|jgi:hypothetical protein|nr:hypothetical protein [Candidatus Bathyarchaeota archaeon]
MIGTAIFLSFFLLFTLASLAVPIPLFPGNVIVTLLSTQNNQYILLLNALANGLTYGFIIWLIFYIGNKKLSKR